MVYTKEFASMKGIVLKTSFTQKKINISIYQPFLSRVTKGMDYKVRKKNNQN